jgi:alkanesulfonate monooxygenase
VFSTCPPSTGAAGDAYVRQVVQVARWSELAGCTGILVYTDNRLIDPWLVAQLIVQNTESLCPLVAIQPIYQHPYAVAKLATSIAHLYGRRVYLNMVAGGFRNDLDALGDPTPHDRRYDRLCEYTLIVKGLLAGRAPVTYRGEFYAVDRLRLTPPVPSDLVPGLFVSGSSEAGLRAARALGATAVMYPKPAPECDGAPRDLPSAGIRVGIIARATDEEAWVVARERFPEDRQGQLLHQLAMKTTDSVWHRQLAGLERVPDGSPYWLGPFQNYKTFCPYLVGSYRRVAGELTGYLNAGYSVFILDVPFSAAELSHTAAAFWMALERCS